MDGWREMALQVCKPHPPIGNPGALAWRGHDDHESLFLSRQRGTHVY